jgi:hypothetical protein
MSKFSQSGVLASTALAGLLCFAGANAASAAQSQPQPIQITAPASEQPFSPANYFWHGRHYAYFWHGRYFNHRSWRNNAWYYYG